ncbi:MAG: DUF342 domain-containing protein [Desulfobacteraceae bacterium]|nr:DUF342 domain-containing protein [Desulfobacteraceae bacterium]
MTDSGNRNNQYPLIGLLALKHGLIEQKDLDKAWLESRSTDQPDRSFADYLITNELVSDRDMKRLVTASRAMEIRNRDVKFGTIAIEKGFISNTLLKLALDEQKQQFTRYKRSRLLGDILVEASMISTRQRDYILKEQNRLKELNQARRKKAAQRGRKPDGKSSTATPEVTANSMTSEDLNGGITLMLPQDGLSAYLLKTDEFDDSITAQDIQDMLSEKHIIFGVVDTTLIDGFIKSSGFKTKPFRIAKGIQPKKGADATIKYFFDTDSLKVGEISSTGEMDFKERGEIPKVPAGEVLAEKIPPVEALDGRNVFGEVFALPPAKDLKMKYGKGARLSEDGLKLVAQLDGQPKLSWSGVVTVLDEYTANGDVDYETGHIDYKGNVKIKGCVQSGFKVTGESIRAEEIHGGIIHAEGDLSISGGINDAVIYAKGNVWAKFIHKSKILCMGDIYTTKEIVESNIENSGACIINQGKIIASEITSKMGIYAGDVGTDRAKPAKLKVGVDIFVLKELEKLKTAIAQSRKKLVLSKEEKEALEVQVKEEQKTTSDLAHIQDRLLTAQRETTDEISALEKSGDQEGLAEQKVRLEKLKKETAKAEDNLNTHFENVEFLEGKLKKINDTIAAEKGTLGNLIVERDELGNWAKKTPGVAELDVTGRLTSGTKVGGVHSETTIQKTLKRAKLKELRFTQPGQDKDKGWWEMRVTS